MSVTEGFSDGIIAKGDELRDGMLQRKPINGEIDSNNDVKEELGVSEIRNGMLQLQLKGSTVEELGVSIAGILQRSGDDPINEEVIDAYVNAVEAEMERKRVIEADLNETVIAMMEKLWDKKWQKRKAKIDVDDVKERESYEAWEVRERATITRGASALREIIDQLKPQGGSTRYRPGKRPVRRVPPPRKT